MDQGAGGGEVEDRGQKTEVRGQRSEDRGQRTEVRCQRSEVSPPEADAPTAQGHKSEVSLPDEIDR